MNAITHSDGIRQLLVQADREEGRLTRGSLLKNNSLHVLYMAGFLLKYL